MVRESLSAWSGVCRVDLVAKVLMGNKVLDFIRMGEQCSIIPPTNPVLLLVGTLLVAS